jgi:GTPase SAR1 family protein
MFDLTRTSTFDNLKGWLHDITVTINRENVQIILIGTKSDLENDREITANMIRQFMEENDITSYHDISCKTGDGIDGLRFTLEKHLVRGTKFIAWEEPEPPSPRQSIWKRLFRWL